MYYFRQRQQGYTLITLSILFMVIGFFILLILKIGPIYMNHSKVVNSFEAVKKTKNIENQSTARIHTILDGRFNVNFVEHVSYKDVLIINRQNYLKMSVEYEVVEHIVGNLSVLVEFYEEIEVGPQG